MHRHLTHLAGAIGVAVAPGEAVAHPLESLAPSSLWTAWSWEPAVLTCLLISGVLYGAGVRRLWARRAGAGIRRWEAASFAAGWLAIVVALVSPLHALGSSLFSAHMAQHELLIGVAAPLLVLGRPLVPFLWSLSPEGRRATGKLSRNKRIRAGWGFLTRPLVAFVVHAVALWVWHLPGPYQSTLHSELMHSAQHASFIITALFFWWTIFGARHGALGHGVAVFYLFATALQTGALGALLTFAPTLWYPEYGATSLLWGLTPLDDQQLGGLIMWIPGSIPYVIAGLALFSRWLGESEARAVRHFGTPAGARTVAIVIAGVLVSSCDRASGDDRYHLTNADPGRGRTAIARYGCGSCHTIPGVIGASGKVGPPLGEVSQRVFIAGVLPNDPDNMIRWIENPPAIDSKTAMPNMGVTPRDARDIASYLYTLR